MIKKKDEYTACCLECNNKLQDTEIIDTKVCLNPGCEKYQVYVTNWYNFEDYK